MSDDDETNREQMEAALVASLILDFGRVFPLCVKAGLRREHFISFDSREMFFDIIEAARVVPTADNAEYYLECVMEDPEDSGYGGGYK